MSNNIKFHEDGFVVYEGKSLLNGDPIVGIITLRSVNRKTGDMAQLWILSAELPPIKASTQGKDTSVCGSCKLRQSAGGICYVELGKSPETVYRAWKNCAYPKLPKEHFSILQQFDLRFGAYGDPAALPMDLLKLLLQNVRNHTSYTHQWRDDKFKELKEFTMASVDSEEEYQLATSNGWRTYRILNNDEEPKQGEIKCPHITSGVQCKNCKLCTGKKIDAKNIAIYKHGARKNNDSRPLDTAIKISIASSENQPKLTGNIIDTFALVDMRFAEIPLQGAWAEFLGRPSHNFCMSVTGSPGHGKSSFCVRFAYELSINHGAVLYNTSEEGISKTMQNKIIDAGAVSSQLHVSDFTTMEALMANVPVGRYQFIFLDSLSDMGITPKGLRILRKHYHNSSIIVICQATKKGQMRGSNVIAHDVDTVINVADGFAVTTKNRFNMVGLRFNAFYDDAFEEPYGQNPLPNAKRTIRRGRSAQSVIEELIEKERDAVAAENYELAARLRDQIKELREQLNKKSNNDDNNSN